ncbi:MAG: IS256 family transposase, partial [Bacillota bacterium]
MTRIPPSHKLREAVKQLFSGGITGDEDVTSTLLRLVAQRLVQELLEQEVTDFLGRGHYEHREEEQPHRGYRNGYKPGR